MTGRSLSARLVATVLLLLAIASTVFAAATAIALRQYLMTRLDADLRATVRVQTHGPPGMDPPQIRLDMRGPRIPDSVIAIVRDGTVVDATLFPFGGGTRAVPEPELPDLAAVPVEERPREVDLGDLGSYRVVANRLPGGDVIVNGLPIAPVQDTVTGLVVIELIVAGITLVAAGVAGTVVVRRALRPLERVAATAARVSVLPLDRGEVSLAERVPDADPRTEVGQVGSALNRMLDHVSAALEARHESEVRLRQFLADASHELRTPLAAISGYAELARRGEPEADSGRAGPSDVTTYSLQRISSQAVRMTALVEDLLLLARLDAGRPLTSAEVDLTRLAVDSVTDAHVAGPGHRWRLAVPEDPVVVPGDPLRLTQVLANLLANARTHTPQGTEVTLSLSTDGSHATVTVLDAGPGIPADLLPHVFERFARGSVSRSRDTGSTGLGLAIVEAVVVAHGGTVTVTSRPGHTAFTVVLPIVR